VLQLTLIKIGELKLKKKYLIDTSVIIDAPALNLHTLSQDGENEIYITEIILKELDKHKTSLDIELGHAARTFFRAIGSRQFTKLDQFPNGDSVKEIDKLSEMTIEFEDFAPITIYIINRTKYQKYESSVNDSKILEVAKEYTDMVLITNDVSFSVIAQGEGVITESLKLNTVVSPEKIAFSKTYEIEESELANKLTELYSSEKKWNQVTVNIMDKGEDTGKRKFFLVNGSGMIKIRSEESDFSKFIVKPQNLEQKFYIDMLESEFKIMAVTGATGSGKTLLAIQSAVNMVNNPDSLIDGIIYMRYTVNTTDKHAELGYRSGDEDQKLGYFNYPLYSAVNFIIEKQLLKANSGKKAAEQASKSGINMNELTSTFMSDNNIVVADIAHARGITISNKIVIFDELQNAPSSILRLIGTRIGKNSKIILMGDIEQVDHPFLSKNRNALVSLLRIAEKDPMVAAIQLKQTVRSEVAEWFQENIR
jgi:PhoH-like ATPase